VPGEKQRAKLLNKNEPADRRALVRRAPTCLINDSLRNSFRIISGVDDPYHFASGNIARGPYLCGLN
jgi:hypothetical protein